MLYMLACGATINFSSPFAELKQGLDR